MYLPQFLLGISAWLSATLNDPGLTDLPVNCIGGGHQTLEALINCFDGYTLRRGNLPDDAAYNLAQPQPAQLTAWTNAVGGLLVDSPNCTARDVPGLVGIYRIDPYTETGTGGRSFCVLSEKFYTSTTGHFVKGWGLLVVPSTRAAVSRIIHISAPHPLFDTGTPTQAAAIFKRTGAKSLLVAGRHRAARDSTFTCMGSVYSTTDPAHNAVRFHLASRLPCSIFWNRSERAFSCRHAKNLGMAECTGWLRGDQMCFHSDARERCDGVRDHVFVRRPLCASPLPDPCNARAH
jgi:hypothetical protein